MLPEPGELQFFAERFDTIRESREEYIQKTRAFYAERPSLTGILDGLSDEAIGQYQDRENPIPRIKKLAQMIRASKIEITTSAQEMIDIFNQFQVIQLRPPTETILVLGCGRDGISDGEHLHAGADTANISMEMNPSVVATWGHSRNNAYFARRKYSMIIDEGPVCIFLSDQNRLEMYFETCREALQPGGLLVLPDHIQFVPPDDFQRDFHEEASNSRARNQTRFTSLIFRYFASQGDE